MKNYKTFYANSNEGCISCKGDDLPDGGNWIISSTADDVLNWLEKCGTESEYYKVTQEVYDAVLETYNIY
jgi:hypothetical protein